MSETWPTEYMHFRLERMRLRVERLRRKSVGWSRYRTTSELRKSKRWNNGDGN